MDDKDGRNNKSEMTDEERSDLLKAANELRTGEKLSPALIAIIIISAFGIVVYVYTAVVEFGVRSALAYFPLAMYVFMYISIIKYVVDYFSKGLDATIDGMLMRYCALTAASIITAGEGLGQGILAINVIILVIVPLMRENLMNPKKAIVIAIIVAVLCVAVAVIKVCANFSTFGTLSGMQLAAFVFDSINPTVQWLLFLALYLIRTRKAKDLVAQVMAQRQQQA